MEKEKQKNPLNRLLKGWQQLFGSSKVEANLPPEALPKQTNSSPEEQEARKMYHHILNNIKHTFPPLTGGILPFNQQREHQVKDGKVIPMSWSLRDSNAIQVQVYTSESNKPNNVIIDKNSAHELKSLLETLSGVIEKERINRLSTSLVRTLGNELGDYKFFAKKDNSSLLETDRGSVDAVVAVKDDKIIAFSLNTHEEIFLSDENKLELNRSLIEEGLKERTRLREEVSVPLMKDYIATLKDKNDITSGDYEQLPFQSHVSKLYGDYESRLEEFHSYTHSPFPLPQEEKEQMLADIKSSHQSFKQELSRIIDVYNRRSQSVNQNALNKLEQLDTIFKSYSIIDVLQQPLKKENIISDKKENAISSKISHEVNPVNQKFNRDISVLTERNANNIVLSLGSPSDILLASGVEDKPMKLYGNKVIKKMKKHGFSLDELRNLPMAVANPIAVFNNYQKERNRSILTDLRTKQGNFLVTIDIGKGDRDIDFNIVTSVFGKEGNKIVNWINKGFATYINKEKALNYLYYPAPIAETPRSSELGTAAKIIINFENPIILGEKKQKNNLYHTMKSSEETLHYVKPSICQPLLSGRWHTLEHLKNKAFQYYGDLMNVSSEHPVSSNGGYLIPMQLSGEKYQGATAVLLSLESNRKGYEFPIFIDIATMEARGIFVREDAQGFPVISEQGVETVYNIDQTDFPVKYPEEYDDMKLRQIFESRLSDPNYTKDVIKASEMSVEKMFEFFCSPQHNLAKDSDLDLRSSTPVDMDVDGNGILESQENLEPDKKQGAEEGQSKEPDNTYNSEKRLSRGR